MRIAFVSYEFPPDTGGGGIGTYLDQVTGMLVRAGHRVDVFCGAMTRAGSDTRSDGVRVHRISGESATAFRSHATAAFAERHRAEPYDVCEGTDFDASALDIKRLFPRLPYVVKLHTPRFLIEELHQRRPSAWQQFRILAGALRRGQWPQRTPVREQPAAREELAAIALADEVASPSRAIASEAISWLPEIANRLSVFPYPFEPSPALLEIKPEEGNPNLVTFIGRLEERKGVTDLATAIPIVRRQCPRARFRFIGRAMTLPDGSDVVSTLRRKLGAAGNATDFAGVQTRNQIIASLRETAILVAPSHWESFGIVCCEGLAAARAVIGSATGGMAETLNGGNCGVLVPPHRPDAIAAAIIALLQDAPRRRELGRAGRDRILRYYSGSVVVRQQLSSYVRAIQHVRFPAPVQ